MKFNSLTAGFAAVPVLLGLSLGVACLGCNSQSNKTPSVSTTVAGSTAAGITAPVGPFPRGTVDPAVLPDPSVVGPTVVVISPERGASTDASTIAVVVSAVDPDGVSEVTIAGEPATSSGDQWTAQVPLNAGVNVLEYEAKDNLGNLTTGYTSLVQGQLHSTQDTYKRGVVAALTPNGLGRVSDVVAQLTSSVDLAPLIASHNPLLSTAGIKLNGTGLLHDPLQYELEGAATGLTIRVKFANVVLSGDTEFIGFGLTKLDLTADEVVASGTMQIDQSLWTGSSKVTKQALGLEFDKINVSFKNFNAKASSGFFNTLLSPFRNTIQDTVRDKLEGILLDLIVAEFQKAIPGIDAPFTFDLPNPLTGTRHGLSAQFEVHEANGTPATGVVLNAGIKAFATSPVPGTNDEVAILGVAPPRPMVPGPEDFGVRLSSDALNAFLHATWQTGIVVGKIEGRNPGPTATLNLTAGLLYPFLPIVRSLAPDPNTPITLVVKTGSAPRIGFGRNPGVPYEIDLPEGEVTLEIDYMDGGPNVEVFTLRFAARAQATIAVENDKLKIGDLALPTITSDVIREPAGDIEDQGIEDAIHALIPMVLDIYKAQIPAIPIPALPFGLNLTSPRLTVDKDYLTVRASL